MLFLLRVSIGNINELLNNGNHVKIQTRNYEMSTDPKNTVVLVDTIPLNKKRYAVTRGSVY